MERTGAAATPSRLRSRLTNTLDHWIKRRARTVPPLTIGYRQIFILPTGFGWMLGLLMFGMLMGSLNFNNNLGLLTTFIVAGLALNSMLMAYHNLRGIQVRRCSAAPVFAGESACLNVTFVNADERSRPALELVHGKQCKSFTLDASASGEIGIMIPTSHRGWLKPARLRLQTSHPIGLFEGWTWFWPEQPILVWPRPARHPPPLPQSAGREQGSRQHREPEGENFYSLRAWRSGDPLHRIAWKASQRHQLLLSREFRAEQAEHLTLDLNRTPGRDLEERISNLTAWLLMAEREGLRSTLRLGAVDIGPASGQAHAYRCLRALAEL